MRSLLLTSCLAVFMVAASASASDLEAGGCGPVDLFEGGGGDSGKSPSPAALRAEPVEAPPLRLSFLDLGDGEPPAEIEISVCYDWRWFRYPVPETLFGSWEIGYECRRCRLDNEGSVTVPAHRVTPRGWYDGWLRFGRGPRFEGIRVNLDHRGHNLSFPRLTGPDLRRLSRDGADELRLETVDLAMTAAPPKGAPARRAP